MADDKQDQAKPQARQTDATRGLPDPSQPLEEVSRGPVAKTQPEGEWIDASGFRHHGTREQSGNALTNVGKADFSNTTKKAVEPETTGQMSDPRDHSAQKVETKDATQVAQKDTGKS